MQRHTLVPNVMLATLQTFLRDCKVNPVMAISAEKQVRECRRWEVVPDRAAVSTGEEGQQCRQASCLLRAMQHLDIVPVVLTHRAWGQPVQGRQRRRRGAPLSARHGGFA